MTNEFKPGDEIVRYRADYSNGRISIGQKYTVELVNGLTVSLLGLLEAYDRHYFVPVDDCVKVELPYKDAVAHLKKYPNSKYLKNAIDAVSSPVNKFEFPKIYETITPDELLKFPLRTTIAIQDCFFEKTDTATWTDHVFKSKWSHELVCSYDNIILTYVPEQKPDSVVFWMPVEEARKIPGCTIPPLVKAWDEAHKPKVEYWKVGDKVGEPLKYSNKEAYASLPIGTIVQFIKYERDIIIIKLDDNKWICTYAQNSENWHMGRIMKDSGMSYDWRIVSLPEGDHHKPQE